LTPERTNAHDVLLREEVDDDDRDDADRRSAMTRFQASGAHPAGGDPDGSVISFCELMITRGQRKLFQLAMRRGRRTRERRADERQDDAAEHVSAGAVENAASSSSAGRLMKPGVAGTSRTPTRSKADPIGSCRYSSR